MCSRGKDARCPGGVEWEDMVDGWALFVLRYEMMSVSHVRSLPPHIICSDQTMWFLAKPHSWVTREAFEPIIGWVVCMH